MNDIERVQPYGIHFLLRGVRPDHRDLVGAVALAEAKSHGQFRLRQVTARGHHLAPQCPAIDAQPDPRANGVAIGLRPDELEAQPMMAQLLVVSKQERRAVDLRQNDVEVAVAVDVGECRAAADNGFENVRAAVPWRDGQETVLPVDSARVPEQLRGLTIALD